MSLGGMINTHVIDAYLLDQFGTPEQQESYLPRMAKGEVRGAFTITEPNAGSDVQAIQTSAKRDGDFYVLNGTKQFVTNGRRAGVFAVICKTDPTANPPYAGMSILLVEPTTPGFTIVRDVEKLGYKGVDTVILRFDDARVPATQLLGGREGRGFQQAMSGLEVGRINVASRAVGVSQAAFEDAIRYAQQRQTFGVPIAEHQAIQFKLAEMATKIEAARLLVYKAAETKDRGERTDLEAGMAKLFATETALEVTTEALRIFGGVGYTKDLRVERLYRDAPFMAIGEGTNEIQHIAIARALLRKYAV
jgi:alkylation response protein AidB-like acyl-CoA dehydrogenase